MTKAPTPLVIKVGGAFIDAPLGQDVFFQNIAKLQSIRPVVIVHGGGAGVQNLLETLGLESHKINGLRVTPAEHMPYVAGALAGTYNTKMLSFAIAQNISAVGLTLADGGMTQCSIIDRQLGAVGDAQPHAAHLPKTLLQIGQLPIINSIGALPNGQLVNVNADQAATAIACLLHADLLLLSDVPGVLNGNKDKVESLTQAQANQLTDDGVLIDGMRVKVDAAFTAANTLNRPVVIGAWSDSEAFLRPNLNGVGTHIFPQ